ncbi:helix-turn-helix domain-containing protein [Kitasatospora acidiphila]|uniref:Helix-turn-helix domain-containing protein n=1 Tax=Kitasatospora acidiphila TaxID=2567942 RepID=A0A540W7X2_9ACTN|nr:helix-turn-helix transcriptional regulator [Kitasatospora acidiphila]TQF04454.1 helix-turn-helix domain-containing protein [Kitasatospora acidiphila]
MNRLLLPATAPPRVEFATQLRLMREALGLTQAQLADRTEYSSVHISAVETGRKPPTLRFAKSMDRAFDSGTKFVELFGRIHGHSLLQGFPEYTAYERNATAVRLFETCVIPGLLQTAEYAAAWESGYIQRGKITQDQANGRVDVLMDRQQLLMKTPSVGLYAIMDETCLRRPVGGRLVMINQLRSLEELASRPKTIIQIAPESLGEAHPLRHPLTLLTMPGGVMLGYTETLQRGLLERDSDTVALWASDYDQLQAEALSRAASLSMIRRLREDLEREA